MTASIALCADATSVRHPDLLGLAGENFAAQKWLQVFSSGEEARHCLRQDRSVVEAWVTSTDDVEPINLAAALKRDRADMRVCLVAFEGTGSLMSRANAAGVDASLTRQAFVARYADAKQRLAGSVASPGRDAVDPLHLDTAARSDTVRCATGQVAPAGRSAFLLPVVSGSGGAGKSTVAALSALLAQGLGYRTLLLDLDLQFGDMRDLMGLPQAIGIDEVLATPARIAKLEPNDSLPALLAAPRHLEDAEAIVRDVPRLLDEVRSRFDVVIVNTGPLGVSSMRCCLNGAPRYCFWLINGSPLCGPVNTPWICVRAAALLRGLFCLRRIVARKGRCLLPLTCRAHCVGVMQWSCAKAGATLRN